MTTSSQISDTNVSDLKEFIIEVTIPLLGKQCAENEYNDTIYFTDGTLRIVQNDSKITIVANQTSGYPFYMNHTLHHVLGESIRQHHVFNMFRLVNNGNMLLLHLT